MIQRWWPTPTEVTKFPVGGVKGGWFFPGWMDMIFPETNQFFFLKIRIGRDFSRLPVVFLGLNDLFLGGWDDPILPKVIGT